MRSTAVVIVTIIAAFLAFGLGLTTAVFLTLRGHPVLAFFAIIASYPMVIFFGLIYEDTKDESEGVE